MLSVSVVQHLPNSFKQLQALRELVRVCRPGGRILLYVWSFEKEDRTPRFDDRSQQHLLRWKLPLASVEALRDSFDRDGVKVDMTEGTAEVARFYYLFVEGELEWLLSYVENVRILQRSFDGKNWCVELQVL